MHRPLSGLQVRCGDSIQPSLVWGLCLRLEFDSSPFKDSLLVTARTRVYAFRFRHACRVLAVHCTEYCLSSNAGIAVWDYCCFTSKCTVPREKKPSRKKKKKSLLIGSVGSRVTRALEVPTSCHCSVGVTKDHMYLLYIFIGNDRTISHYVVLEGQKLRQSEEKEGYRF